ncbi:MAG: hypothetical protein AVDCRST_MAG30-4621, partial [uncultured Solirubrobacteraceae bacterium]
ARRRGAPAPVVPHQGHGRRDHHVVRGDAQEGQGRVHRRPLSSPHRPPRPPAAKRLAGGRGLRDPGLRGL